MINDNLVELWNKCLTIIRDNIPEKTYKTWFADIKPLRYEDKELTVQVPSQFVYEFIEENFVELLRATLFKVMGEGTRLMYNVLTDKTNGLSVKMESTSHPVTYSQAISKGNKSPNILLAPAVQDLNPMLNPSCVFDNFVEGNSNKLSYSIALATAQNPGKTTFNPLFFFGASGVGKTHLVNAIGNRIKELSPRTRVLYVSAHLFQVQYTDSVRNNTFNDFINFYQTIDVLIIDDIQEFASLSKTQNTFFHIFNHLHQNGKQLIMTSDRPPVLLQGMEERLITRFKWGLTAEMEKPDFNLRKDILRCNIRRNGLIFPDNVIDYIAENITESIRDLEGIVNSIMVNATVYNKDIDLELAQSIVRKTINYRPRAITIDEILEKVCNHYSVSVESINTKSRKREVVQVRQISMYFAKTLLDISTSKIGQRIGNRDHATVLHAIKIVKDQMDVDKQFRSEMEEIEAEIKH